MASFEVRGFETILSELDRIGKFEEIAPKMMEDGMKVLQKEVVAEASKHVNTGEMAASIKPTGVEAGFGGGYYMCTRPTGKDKRGVRNMEKMAWLEYGVKGRPATPVITKAVIRAEPGVIEAMRSRFAQEVNL